MNALVKPYSKATEEFLEDLAAELEVPNERYDAAERSYKSVGEWLQREELLAKALVSEHIGPGVVPVGHGDPAG